MFLLTPTTVKANPNQLRGQLEKGEQKGRALGLRLFVRILL